MIALAREVAPVDWTALVERYGILAVILGGGGYGLLHTARFIAYDLIVPLRDKSIKLIERIMVFFDKLDVRLDAVEQRDAARTATAQLQEDVLWNIREAVTETRDRVERIESRLASADPPEGRRAGRRRQEQASSPASPQAPQPHPTSPPGSVGT